MADPVVPVAAGLSAVIVGLFGIEPQVLFFALVGAGLGVPATSPAKPARRVLVFLLVVIASALLGSWGAVEYFSDSTPARFTFAARGISLVLALAFHPLTSVLVASIPNVVDGALRKVGLKQ